MKYRFPEEFINKVRESNDIVEVASEYMTLTKTGDRYRGLCPFHREDTPSFYISSDKQLYHCFGCGAGGNIFNFIMNIENLDFIDAVKLLADRSRIPLPQQDFERGLSEKYRLLEEILNINHIAASYFVNCLSKSRKAKQYLLQRGMDAKTVRQFGLGYAPDGWDNLLNHLKSKGLSQEMIIKSGLASERKTGSGIYDRFRNRIMFPIVDVRNKVIGFGGRILGDGNGPKYLNSPETPVFTKGNNLYGLNVAKNHIENGEIIVVEGYMDVISLHQKGIKNTVASLGTAFTPSQGQLLKRYSSNVVIAYDSDAAGQAATLKGMDILESAGCSVRIIEFPDGKDPDEYVQKYGKEAFQQLIRAALPLTDYKIKLLERKYDIKDRHQKLRFLQEVAVLLAGLDSELEIAEYVKSVSQRAEIYESALRKEILNIRNRDKGQNRNIFGKYRHNNSAGEYSYSIRPANIEAEKNILVMALKDKTYRSEIIARISSEDFTDEFHRNLFEIVKSKYIDRELLPADLVSGFNSQDEINRVVALIDEELPVSDEEKGKFIDDCINTIQIHRYRIKGKELKSEIDRLAAKTNRTGEEEKILKEYWAEFVNIQRKLKGL
jgi:DNA primase